MLRAVPASTDCGDGLPFRAAFPEDNVHSPVHQSHVDAARDATARRFLGAGVAVREDLDGLARLASRICDAPIALISLVTEDSQVFLGRSGLDVPQTPREQSFCAHAMYHARCMIVSDASEDPRFFANPLVTGTPHIRFYAGQPLTATDGTPLGSLCVIDTAPRLALSEAQRDGLETLAKATVACLERWRSQRDERHVAAAVQEELYGMSRQFETLADALPQLVWSAPADGMSDYFSAQWCLFTGAPPDVSYGRGWLDFVHAEDIETALRAWTHAVETAQSYAVEYRLRRHDGEYRWMLARGEPICDRDGTVTRWIGTCTDIDERVRTGEMLELMSQELSHRIKNLFGAVQGLISMTLRGHPEMAEVNQALQARMAALGRAHDLVRPRIHGGAVWRSQTGLRDLLDHLLAPYQDEAMSRITIVGDDIVVNESAATPLALFFHELATNSARFGALGSATGRVDIALTCGEEVTVRWIETGGPAIPGVPAPAFGMRLSSMLIERQLGGKLDMDWRQEGLDVLARVQRSLLAAD